MNTNLNEVKAGDIIRWEGIGVSSKDMRVVEVWDQGEPFQFLVTPLDDYSSTPKCYVVLAVDCVLVRKGEPPKRVRTETVSPVRMPNSLGYPGVIAEDPLS